MNPTRYKLVPENEPRQAPPEPQKPRHHFRWAAFVGVPLVLAAILFLLNGIDPSFEIEDLLYKLKVVNQSYIRMMCLMIVCVAILLIVKLFRKNPE